jgi:superfamily II DNA/RNA helicase
VTTFADLGISAHTLSALARSSIDAPVEVQERSIPALLQSRHVVIEAPTGSGKTLAFMLPLVERFRGATAPGPRALVVAPTRELAIQAERVLTTLDSGLHVALIYGGVGYATQEHALRKGADVVIGTPGRILDMVSRRKLALSRVQYLVLDEGDEMLDAGFAPDVERIIGLTYEPQIVLASATMPNWVTRVIERHLHDPLRVKVAAGSEPDLEHGLIRVPRAQKLRALSQVLHAHRGSVIVFGRTKHGVRKLSRDLRGLGHDSADLQGNLSQSVRDRTMDAFRALRTNVLVATNVAARGLDISHVDLVINYELPDSAEWLTHRVGRTARMGAAGRALTFLSPEDDSNWRKLRRQGAPDLPEVDLGHFVNGGGWRYVAATLMQPSGPAAPTAAPRPAGPPRRRRQRGRRWGRPAAARGPATRSA